MAVPGFTMAGGLEDGVRRGAVRFSTRPAVAPSNEYGPQYWLCDYDYYCCQGDADCNALFSSPCAGPGACYWDPYRSQYWCWAYREC
jgi:hypothetical protein